MIDKLFAPLMLSVIVMLIVCLGIIMILWGDTMTVIQLFCVAVLSLLLAFYILLYISIDNFRK